MSQSAKSFVPQLPKFDFEETLSRSTSQHSIVSSHSNERALDLKSDVFENAEKWSCAKKLFAVGTSLLIVTNSAISSSLPGGAVVYTAVHFQVTSQQQLALPMSVFLVGYIFGPLAFGPLSETYGRRIILLITFTGYTIFTLACPKCLNIGPAIGPIISGFTATFDWRWEYWIALMIAAISWVPLLFLPETYGPVLEARRIREARNKASIDEVAPLPPIQRPTAKEIIVSALIRPMRLFAEPIVLATSSLMALVYAIFYLFFEAYPLIFG
ncbi:MAG: hypothetical protein Q9195_001334, partial [Heterodermia aff. obscurata]